MVVVVVVGGTVVVVVEVVVVVDGTVVVVVIVVVVVVGYSHTSKVLDHPYFAPTSFLQTNPVIQSSFVSQSPSPTEHLQVGEQ